METLPLTVYTSPRTGTEYLVVPRVQRRTVGGVLTGTPLHWVNYTKFEIVLNGTPVQFCYDEAEVASTVRHFENPGPDTSSRYD